MPTKSLHGVGSSLYKSREEPAQHVDDKSPLKRFFTGESEDSVPLGSTSGRSLPSGNNTRRDGKMMSSMEEQTRLQEAKHILTSLLLVKRRSQAESFVSLTVNGARIEYLLVTEVDTPLPNSLEYSWPEGDRSGRGERNDGDGWRYPCPKEEYTYALDRSSGYGKNTETFIDTSHSWKHVTTTKSFLAPTKTREAFVVEL